MRILLTLLIALTIPLFSQPPGGDKKGPAHKNLKLLKDEEVRPAMAAFQTALGYKCNDCHAQGENGRPDFASDANPKKLIARTMIEMVREDNGKFLAGKTQLTCYTCHRGEAMPKTTPPAAQ